MRQPINPYDIAPASARRVSSEFTARCRDGAWEVTQDITWKNIEADWDGTFVEIAKGLTEAQARELAAQLSGEARRDPHPLSAPALPRKAA